MFIALLVSGLMQIVQWQEGISPVIGTAEAITCSLLLDSVLRVQTDGNVSGWIRKTEILFYYLVSRDQGEAVEVMTAN